MDVDELLGRVMDLILPVVDADRGCVLLKDTETGEPLPAGGPQRGRARARWSEPNRRRPRLKQHREC